MIKKKRSERYKRERQKKIELKYRRKEVTCFRVNDKCHNCNLTPSEVAGTVRSVDEETRLMSNRKICFVGHETKSKSSSTDACVLRASFVVFFSLENKICFKRTRKKRNEKFVQFNCIWIHSNSVVPNENRRLTYNHSLFSVEQKKNASDCWRFFSLRSTALCFYFLCIFNSSS